MTDNPLSSPSLLPVLERIASALERMSPSGVSPLDFSTGATAFVWHTEPDRLEPVESVNAVDYDLLQGIDHQRQTLLQNTERFAGGFPANNALLWGARGTGKSSIVKAVHDKINREQSPKTLYLVEIHREDIPSLPRLLAILKKADKRFILFCDDLSFDAHDDSYKSLKAVLEGGVEGRPGNVLFYATSNRRHLMPRDMIENEMSTAIHAGEAVEENVSLSDRFGLWIGFHNCDQNTYIAMITGYLEHFDFPDFSQEELETIIADAKEWSVTRGSRSGRVAWQFIQNLAGEHRVHLSGVNPS
ncbi:ATP-binding protein [Kiloniella sp. b19]|uniref:ATP-binding protein n=1 Tax=Kiloniella sp. GXU_MW_B19 TaxID=3141326 RepID=UPI0031CFD54B